MRPYLKKRNRFQQKRWQYRMPRRDFRWRRVFTKATVIAFAAFFLVFGGFTFYVLLDTVNSPRSILHTVSGVPDTSEASSGVSSEKPATGKQNILLGCTDDEGERLLLLFLIQADMDHKQFYIAALPSEAYTKVDSQRDTLQELYTAGGISGLREAVETLGEIKVDRYLILTQTQMEKALDRLGTLPYTVDRDLDYAKGGLTIRIRQGEQSLSGAMILQLMQYPAWEEGEKYSYTVRADLLGAVLRQLLIPERLERGEDVFESLVKDARTDIAAQDYADSASALRQFAALDTLPTYTVVLPGAFTEMEGRRVFKLEIANGNVLRDNFGK